MKNLFLQPRLSKTITLNWSTSGNERVEMKIPAWTPFGAIFQNEVRINSKRIAPYFMALLCAGNGLLWWGWGPATGHGWAVNADFFIAGFFPFTLS